MCNRRFMFIVLSGLLPSIVWAQGYDQTYLWSGRYATKATSTSDVNDSQALYFNPAGLAGLGSPDVSLNFSPSFARFSAPIAEPNKSINSSWGLLPNFGVFGQYPVTDKLGVGIGSY